MRRGLVGAILVDASLTVGSAEMMVANHCKLSKTLVKGRRKMDKADSNTF